MEPATPLKQIGYAMAAAVPGASIRHKLRVYRQAVERGRRADKLTVAPWEDLFDRPLPEVRGLLGIAPAAQAHPQGTWYTTWTPRGAEPLDRWNYDEVFIGETP
jgi:hypothetical protein